MKLLVFMLCSVAFIMSVLIGYWAGMQIAGIDTYNSGYTDGFTNAMVLISEQLSEFEAQVTMLNDTIQTKTRVIA